MDARLNDVVEEMGEGIVDFDNAMNLLYVMCEAAECGDLDWDKYASALHVVWKLLHEIENRVIDLQGIVNHISYAPSPETAATQ